MTFRGSRAAAAAAVAVAALAGAADASPISGRWHTQSNNGIVEVSDCGPGVCGRVLTSDRIRTDPNLQDSRNKDPALRTRPIRGMALFEEMTGGPRVWRGRVYNPEDGKTYSGSVTSVSADKMKLTGCVLRIFCKSQTWTRVP